MSADRVGCVQGALPEMDGRDDENVIKRALALFAGDVARTTTQ